MKLTGLSTLGWICTLSGSIGSLLPGLSYFTSYAPPMFEASSLLTGGVALAVILLALTTPISQETTVKHAFNIILTGFIVVILYGIAYNVFTISTPKGWEKGRIQTGFSLNSWSLTDKAESYLNKNPSSTTTHLVESFGAYNNVDKVWKSWSIQLAGLLLIILFSVGFVLWAYGFARLAIILDRNKNEQDFT